MEINEGAFDKCRSLRNVAFPPNADISDDILSEATDLLQLFGEFEQALIIRALQNRFNGQPIHKLVYYLSYHQGELHLLIASGDELSPTGNLQDCLGMTPLHILACSSVHDLEVYRVIVENYPTNLITADRWGAVPLLYAFWGGAPHDITQFLLNSYQSLHPNHVFNWTMMVETMGRCDTPIERIENLLHVKQTLPKDVTEIGNGALTSCYCLRNVAIPANADVGYNIFIEEGMTPISDLWQLFGNSNVGIIDALQHRLN